MRLWKQKLRISPFLLLLTFTVFPGNAWAVQSHGAPEGLYVHQLAHIFYTAAMCYLFWGIRRSVFKSQAWRYLQIFCIFTILWNVVAFTGHFLATFISDVHFVRTSGYLSTGIQGPFSGLKLWYYFTKLDHLFSIPALFFLFLGMRTLYHNGLEEEE